MGFSCRTIPWGAKVWACLALVATFTMPIRPVTAAAAPDCTPFAQNTELTDQLLSQPILPPCAGAVTRNGPKTPIENLQHGFDLYSWLTFVALNSPQASGAGAAAFGPDLPTVWESWKQIDDVMLPPGTKPNPAFNVAHAVPTGCVIESGREPALVVHMGEETYDQPFRSGPLIDQDGHYSLNVILMNQDLFDSIMTHHLYDAHEQQTAERVSFPAGTNKPVGQSAPFRGAMMIKASWKVLTAADDPKEFHKIWALLFIPASPQSGSARCSTVRLGLVGFHVAHKTQDRNQWVWTTFEHFKNSPTRSDVDAGTALANAKANQGRYYHFYNPTCPVTMCPENQTPPGPWDMLQPPAHFKSQIVRVRAPTDDAEAINSKALALTSIRDSVWKSYRLISTQWPTQFGCAGFADPETQPDPTCAPAPVTLANTTLETFSQDAPTGGAIPQATSSCIGCHNNATTHAGRQSDFTFILEKAQLAADPH